MSDIHALSGAYAIDALDDIERAQFERHLAECAECRAEVDGLREAGGMLAEAVAAAPPASLRDRVLADIATVRPLPPVTVPATQQRRRFRPVALVAAAAAVIALGAGAVVWQPWADETSQSPQLSAADQIRQAPDAEEYTQTLPGGAEATLLRSQELNKAVLVTENMPPPPAGKTYELWLNHEGVGMVPAGLMDATETEVPLEGDAATATGAGITVEPSGGSEEPTLPPVTLFEFENA
jgi:anti-sigma-K factor RskA